MTLTEKEEIVPKPEEEVAQERKISQKKLEKQKLTALGINAAKRNYDTLTSINAGPSNMQEL